MDSRIKTEHSKISFRVSEGTSNAYVSTREDPDLTLFQNGTSLFFTLNDDSFANAQRVVNFLNDHIDQIHIGIRAGHPMFDKARG